MGGCWSARPKCATISAVVAIRTTGTGFGAYVDGVDLAVVPDDATLGALQAALDEHLVLIFRNGPTIATDAQVVAFCSAFGPLRPSLADKSRLADYPAINLVANRNLGAVEGSGGSGALHYHSDLHHEPPLIEFIYLDALQVPRDGGATVWVDLRAAYDELTGDRKELINPLTVRYALRKDLDYDTYFKASADGLAARKQSTEVSLVQANGRTGRKAFGPTRVLSRITPHKSWVWIPSRVTRCSPSCSTTVPRIAFVSATAGSPATRACGTTSRRCTAERRFPLSNRA
jgi:alpha-ketoglutarate-dependent taurine dioxygenase